MRVRELIALLQTLPPDAAVAINGQEYHLTGAYETSRWEFPSGSAVAIRFDVGLGLPGWFTDILDAGFRAETAGRYEPHVRVPRG